MDSNKAYYLFCYFTGNEPENESVHFAISKNGFDFEPVNGGKKIIEQKLGKKMLPRSLYFQKRKRRILHYRHGYEMPRGLEQQ